ncbi:MAG: TorF family putative porin [Pseudomonadales bacterium]
MKIFNAVKIATASSLLLVGLPVMALELGAGFEGSGNIGLSSNYMWRGISQTRNGVAVQGGVDITHSSGFYTGTWLSNVDFKLAPRAHTEQDIYAGYGFNMGDFAFDLKHTKYLYDNANALDFNETHAQVSYNAGSIGSFAVGLDYSKDTPIVDADSAVHYYGSHTYALLIGATLTTTLGQYDYKDAGWLGGTDSKYSYYNIGVSKEFYGVNVGLAYTDSNIDENNCKIFAGGDGYCGGSLVLSVVKVFK